MENLIFDTSQLQLLRWRGVICCLLSVPLGLAQTRQLGHLRRTDAPGTGSLPISQSVAATPSASVEYTFTVLDFPGTFYTNGFGINPGATSTKIEIVGGIGNQVAEPIGYTKGFQLQYAATKSATTETFGDVNVPSAVQQASSGVNDSGEIVGYYSDASGTVHGYMQSGGALTIINVPFTGATGTNTYGIDNSGEIVGSWSDATTTHGFMLSGGTYTSFDYPGAAFTIANGLNNHGDIVGFYGDTSGVYHGFLLSGGIYSAIDVPGATATEAYGINDAGNTVGIYCPTSACLADFASFHGFMLSNGVFSTIQIPGAAATGPVNINNSGVIAGVFHDTVGRHAFLATPK